MTFEAMGALFGMLSIAGSAGMTFGILRGSLSKKMDIEKHTDICHVKSTEVYEKIDTNHKETMAALMEIKQELGYLKGRQEK